MCGARPSAGSFTQHVARSLEVPLDVLLQHCSWPVSPPSPGGSPRVSLCRDLGRWFSWMGLLQDHPFPATRHGTHFVHRKHCTSLLQDWTMLSGTADCSHCCLFFLPWHHGQLQLSSPPDEFSRAELDVSPYLRPVWPNFLGTFSPSNVTFPH